jgi:hypothetical protein
MYEEAQGTPSTDTQMPGEAWKDTAQHLRTVQFSLTVASFALFATPFLTHSEDASGAHQEVREIVAALNDSAGGWVEHFMGASPLPALSATFAYPKGELTVIMPLGRIWVREDAAPARERGLLAKEATLGEFREAWDRFHRAELLTASDDYNYYNQQIGQSDMEIGQATIVSKNPSSIPTTTVTFQPLPLQPRPGRTDSAATRFVAFVSDTGYWPSRESELQEEGFRVPVVPHNDNVLWRSTEIPPGLADFVVTARVVLHPLYQNDIHGRWSFGLFRRAFPYLDGFASRYASVPIATLEAVLLAEVQRSEEIVELFGTRVPTEEFAKWGSPVVLVIQLYLLLHLWNLLRLLPAETYLSQVAWIALYPDRAARWATATSLILFPFVVIVALALSTDMLDAGRSASLAVAYILAAGLLGFLIWKSLRDLWRIGSASVQ